jgi:hypothetical protein
LFIVCMHGGHDNLSCLLQIVVRMVNSVTSERFLAKSQKNAAIKWKYLQK